MASDSFQKLIKYDIAQSSAYKIWRKKGMSDSLDSYGACLNVALATDLVLFSREKNFLLESLCKNNNVENFLETKKGKEVLQDHIHKYLHQDKWPHVNFNAICFILHLNNENLKQKLIKNAHKINMTQVVTESLLELVSFDDIGGFVSTDQGFDFILSLPNCPVSFNLDSSIPILNFRCFSVLARQNRLQNVPITNDAFQKTTDGNDFYFFVLAKNATNILYGSYFG
ncbi:hypothetical protein KAZ82_00590, partial [Candidatus Babeliales bacterium]|nr:hypothetical protein [Candidatus Babeliales bacterium]